MLPDTGERYLSTPLFADIGADMDEAELALSRSTPGARFDAPPPPASPEEPPAVAVPAEAEAFVDDAIADPAQPVVMFALAWCEFCWAARKLFAALGVPYRSIDLDSVALQENDLGNRIRLALAARAGARTIPQIWIGGRHVGGCSELFDAFADGRLERWLLDCGIQVHRPAGLDPYSLLPGWLHPRRTAA